MLPQTEVDQSLVDELTKKLLSMNDADLGHYILAIDKIHPLPFVRNIVESHDKTKSLPTT